MKVQRLPNLLIDMAVDGLRTHVRDALDSGGADDYVWAFFDGRVVPGRSVAMQQLLVSGMPANVAHARIDDGVKAARSAGKIFAIGVMTTRSGFVGLLQSLSAGGPGVASIEMWLREPLPDRHFRMAIVAGNTTQTQLVSLDALLGTPMSPRGGGPSR